MIFTPNQKALYQLALQVFGAENQLAILQEECGELVTAVSHFRRDRIQREALLDEIAGVHVMVSQAVIIFGEEAYKKALERQLSKLLHHIKVRIHEDQSAQEQSTPLVEGGPVTIERAK